MTVFLILNVFPMLCVHPLKYIQLYIWLGAGSSVVCFVSRNTSCLSSRSPTWANVRSDVGIVASVI